MYHIKVVPLQRLYHIKLPEQSWSLAWTCHPKWLCYMMCASLEWVITFLGKWRNTASRILFFSLSAESAVFLLLFLTHTKLSSLSLVSPALLFSLIPDISAVLSCLPQLSCEIFFTAPLWLFYSSLNLYDTWMVFST